MSEAQVTPQQIFDSMPQALVPEKAGSTKATIQFDLSGDQGGKWWVKIHDGQAESGHGDAPETPQLTLMADASPSRWRASSAARANNPYPDPPPGRGRDT